MRISTLRTLKYIALYGRALGPIWITRQLGRGAPEERTRAYQMIPVGDTITAVLWGGYLATPHLKRNML